MSHHSNSSGSESGSGSSSSSSSTPSSETSSNLNIMSNPEEDKSDSNSNENSSENNTNNVEPNDVSKNKSEIGTNIERSISGYQSHDSDDQSKINTNSEYTVLESSKNSEAAKSDKNDPHTQNIK